MRQKIEIHIDELLLDGFAAYYAEGIKVAVETELSRLFAEQGVPPEVHAPKGLINGGSFSLEKDSKPNTVGNNIAGAVYQGIKNSGKKK